MLLMLIPVAAPPPSRRRALTDLLPRWREKMLHATLNVGDNALMGSRPVPEQYEQPKSFSVLIGIDDPVDAERIFHALAESGTVQMPLQNTFWSVRLGVLDRLDLAFSEGKPRL